MSHSRNEPFSESDEYSRKKPEFKIVETWLSRKPSSAAFAIAFYSTASLALIYFLSWSNLFGWSDELLASRDLVFAQGEWWRAFSSALVHADAGHLLSNGFLFFILSYYLAGYFGLTLFPVLAFVFGGVINFAVLWNYPGEVKLLGASGIVYWMGGVWLALYVGLDRRRRFSQRVLRAVGVGLLLFLPSEAFDPKISYMAHAVGFAFGVITGTLYFFLRRTEFRALEVAEQIPEEREWAYVLAADGQSVELVEIDSVAEAGPAGAESRNETKLVSCRSC